MDADVAALLCRLSRKTTPGLHIHLERVCTWHRIRGSSGRDRPYCRSPSFFGTVHGMNCLRYGVIAFQLCKATNLQMLVLPSLGNHVANLKPPSLQAPTDDWESHRKPTRRKVQAYFSVTLEKTEHGYRKNGIPNCANLRPLQSHFRAPWH